MGIILCCGQRGWEVKPAVVDCSAAFLWMTLWSHTCQHRASVLPFTKIRAYLCTQKVYNTFMVLLFLHPFTGFQWNSQSTFKFCYQHIKLYMDRPLPEQPASPVLWCVHVGMNAWLYGRLCLNFQKRFVTLCSEKCYTKKLLLLLSAIKMCFFAFFKLPRPGNQAINLN